MKEKRGETLIDAPQDKEFVFHDNTRAKNLYELAARLEVMQDLEFLQFANREKNDFSSWIEYVLLDTELAGRIRKIYSRAATIQAIRDRISEAEVQESIVKLSKDKTRASAAQALPSGHIEGPTAHAALADVASKISSLDNISHGAVNRADDNSNSKDDSVSSHTTDKDTQKNHANGTNSKTSESRENALWTILYIVLIVLIAGLLAYKLFIL